MSKQSSNAAGGDHSQQMFVQMVYTRDVNQLSSRAEPALTLLQRICCSRIELKCQIRLWTDMRGVLYTNILYFFILFASKGFASKWELTARFHHQRGRRTFLRFWGYKQNAETSSWRVSFVTESCVARRAPAYPQATETHGGVSASSARRTYRHTHTHLFTAHISSPVTKNGTTVK